LTERLYYTDPSVWEFEATVVATGVDERGEWVELDRTAFYPTSGGQPADRGEINNVRVTEVAETEDGSIRHFLSAAPSMRGERVIGRIDVERRWRHRQQHTAQHMISALFERCYGFPTVSVHLGEDYSAVELEAPSVTVEQRERVEQEVNWLVRSNEEVEVLMISSDEAVSLPLRKAPDRTGMLRIIRIGDLDWSACGGTHCRCTAEVGIVKLIGMEKQRGHILVKFLAGGQALADYARRFSITESLTSTLTCHIDDLPGNIGKLIDENREQKRAVTALQKQLIPVRVQELAARVSTECGHRLVYEQAGFVDGSHVSALASELADRIDGIAALVFDGRLILAVSASCGLNAGDLVRAICASTGLRGGGNAAVAQIGGVAGGMVDACRGALLEALGRA
jgi:alanyl-tRNA synthetase